MHRFHLEAIYFCYISLIEMSDSGKPDETPVAQHEHEHEHEHEPENEMSATEEVREARKEVD